jgi:DNA-binding NarL/FixJ family response regulator
MYPRKLQLARLIAQGKSNRQIATEMGITVGTVKQYLKTIFMELGIHNRTELAMWVVKNFPKEGWY